MSESVIGDVLFDIAIGSTQPTSFAVGYGYALYGFNPNLYTLNLSNGLITGPYNLGDDPGSLAVTSATTGFVGKKNATTGVPLVLSGGFFQAHGTVAVTGVNYSGFRPHASVSTNVSGTNTIFLVCNDPGNFISIADTGTPTFASHSLGVGLSAVNVYGVVLNPSNGNPVFSCSDGHIREYDKAAFTIVQDITIPAFVTDGLATQNPICDDLIFYPDGTRIFVSVAQGIVYHLQYPSGTLIESKLVSAGQTTMSYSTRPQVGFGNIVNGFLSLWVGSQSGTIQSASVWNVLTNNMMEVDEISWPGANANMLGCFIDSVSETFVVCWFGNGDTRVTAWKMNYLNSNPTADTMALTGSPAAAVAQRCIRIPYFGPGKQFVESDTNESAGLQTLAAQYDDLDYQELSIINNKAAGEAMDMRVFQA